MCDIHNLLLHFLLSMVNTCPCSLVGLECSADPRASSIYVQATLARQLLQLPLDRAGDFQVWPGGSDSQWSFLPAISQNRPSASEEVVEVMLPNDLDGTVPPSVNSGSQAASSQGQEYTGPIAGHQVVPYGPRAPTNPPTAASARVELLAPPWLPQKSPLLHAANTPMQGHFLGERAAKPPAHQSKQTPRDAT